VEETAGLRPAVEGLLEEHLRDGKAIRARCRRESPRPLIDITGAGMAAQRSRVAEVIQGREGHLQRKLTAALFPAVMLYQGKPQEQAKDKGVFVVSRSRG
jgi:hypothetical protein